MSFIAAPSPIFLLAERLFPLSLRSVIFWTAWGVAGSALLFPVVLGIEWLGVSFILLGLAIGYTFANLFFSYGVEEPPLRESLAAAAARVEAGEQANIIPWCAREVASAFPPLGKPHAADVLTRLIMQGRAQMIFARLGISQEEASRILSGGAKSTPADLAVSIREAAAHALRHGHDRVLFADALVAFGKVVPAFADLLFAFVLDMDDFDAVAHWEDRLQHIRDRRRRFWEREYLLAIKPFGREWSYGYTPTIDRFAVDLSKGAEGRQSATATTLGHVQELQALERALAKTSSTNALVVYEPGVGVRDILGGFASRIIEGRSLPILNYRRVLAADFGAAIAGLKTAGEVEGRVRAMLAEAARAGGTILVVENLHNLIGGEMGGQPIDLTATFLPFLETSKIQIVATSTFTGLHGALEKREGFMRLFEKVEAVEPDQSRAVQIILETLPFFERRFEVYVSYPVLKSLVALADQTIQDVPFPKKGFDVLEEAMIAANNLAEHVLTKERVAGIISERTHVPVGSLTQEEQSKLARLETLLHDRVVGQEHAITTVANALRRARAGVRGGEATRPMGTFLFMGPTGVGKTETAKAIAEVYFGSEDLMLRLDMSEFQGDDAVDRLIGSPATKEEGRLTTLVREHPFAVLLLDEFEKMHRQALDLFLPIFDEGIMRDGWGRKVTFTNTLIIATSNAGAEFIRQWIERRGDDAALDEELREEVLRKGIYRPELLNRFDDVVVYQPLTQVQVGTIAERMLKHFSDTLYDEKGIRVAVEPAALTAIVSQGFNQEFGARELRRVLQDNVETAVAKRILDGSVKRGGTIVITAADLGAA